MQDDNDDADDDNDDMVVMVVVTGDALRHSSSVVRLIQTLNFIYDFTATTLRISQ